MKVKTYTFSETYEDYKIDDYIAQGDNGPWYEVVPKQAYTDLLKECEAMAEALKTHLQAISCLKHNCPVDTMFLALNPSQPIVLEAIDMSQKESTEALARFKKFKRENA